MRNESRMIGFRAEQLCIMHFTRSDKFKLVANYNGGPLMGSDPYLDLVFDVRDGAFIKGYNLGVTLKATKGPEGIARMLSKFRTEPYRKIFYPVVLVVFDVTSDKGYYSWINLPLSGRKGTTAKAITPDSVIPFNSKALNDIMNKVSLFYYDSNTGWT